MNNMNICTVHVLLLNYVHVVWPIYICTCTCTCISPLSYQKEEGMKWMESIPLGLDHKLKNMVLVSPYIYYIIHRMYNNMSVFALMCSWYKPSNNTQILFLQAKAAGGELIVNFDSTLHEVLSEVHYLSHPPLSLRMPPVIKSLMKDMNQKEMYDRRASLELVMQVYRDVQTGMSEEEKLLLHSKLQQVEKVHNYVRQLLHVYSCN